MQLSVAFVVALVAIGPTSAFLFKSYPTKGSSVQPIYPPPPSKTVSRIKFPPLGEVSVPIISSHSVQVVPVAVDAPVSRPQLIAVEPSSQAVHLLFKSASSPLLIQQQHLPSLGTVYEATRSQDQPHVLRHEVYKPVIAELHETIQPIRHITQEVRPVLEKIHVVVPKGYPRQPSPPHPVQQQEEQQQQVEQDFE